MIVSGFGRSAAPDLYSILKKENPETMLVTRRSFLRTFRNLMFGMAAIYSVPGFRLSKSNSKYHVINGWVIPEHLLKKTDDL